MSTCRLQWKAVVVCLMLSWGTSAGALSIDFSPASITHAQGTSFSLSAVLSGMPAGQALSTYDFDIVFDPLVLSLLSVSESNALCDQSGGAACQGISSFFMATPGSGTVNLFDLSFASDAQLIGQQVSSLTLFTLTFEGIAQGVSALGFSVNALGGVLDPQTGFTTDLLQFEPTLGTGQATIVGASVPEPGSLALFATGLILLLFARLSRSRR